MQANWSLILNVLLLIGVVIAIARTLKARHHASPALAKPAPSMGSIEKHNDDDIIAVRKVTREEATEVNKPLIRATAEQSTVASHRSARMTPSVTTLSSTPPSPSIIEQPPKPSIKVETQPLNAASVMMFLLAKEGRQLAGYELLQTVLAAGLRFGEGNLFHRHQNPNGQGPILCSLAAATPTGTFDLQSIGAFTVRGLCLFMQASGNATIDGERFEIMLETAKQLSEGLDTHLLDDKRQPVTEMSIKRYHQQLKLETAPS